MPQIIIYLKSFDIFYLKKNINIIHKLCLLLNCPLLNNFYCPIKCRKFTVLRSPHIDKKSREQFEIKKFKTYIKIQISTVSSLFFLFNILKSLKLPGVETKIIVSFSSYYK